MLKKIFAAVLCVCTIATALVSCGSFVSNSDNSSNTAESKENNTVNPISLDEALVIAKEHWKSYDIEKNGYIVAEAVNNSAPETVYVFVIKHLVKTKDSSYYSTFDEIWVDQVTGEVVIPYDAKPGLMFDYDEVLWCYKYAVDYYNYNVNDSVDDVIDRFNSLYGKHFLNETEREWFSAIATSGYILYPGTDGDRRFDANNACGYAKKDLNGDGIEELVLLNANYTLVAIFSMCEGKPFLLRKFWNRSQGWIDSNGYIHIGGSNGADSGSRTIYRIADGGADLDLLFEYGMDGHEWVGDAAVSKYYKICDGNKKYITEEEYNLIDKQYEEYIGNMLGREVTKTSSGLHFKSLFTPMLTFSTYNNILDSLRFMTRMYNIYKLAYASREDFEYRYDLSTEENREMYEKLDNIVRTWYPPALGGSSPYEDAFAYGIKDLNGDGIDELVIIEGDRLSVCAVFTEKDGKIVLDSNYSFRCPPGERSQILAYFIKTVGLDLKPLFAESVHFDLDYIRKEAIYEFDRVLTEAPFSEVWVPQDEERVWIMQYRANTPSGKKPLSKIKDLKFAFIDMDGDTVDELVIDCGELIVLHYNGHSVYLYTLSIDQAYKLNTDGTLMWKSNGETFEYGESRVVGYYLDGDYDTEELWKIVNDGEENAEYYICGKQVTKEEMQKYLAENEKTPVEFLPLDELWGDMLSPLEAIDVGREYWKKFLNEENVGVELRFRSYFYTEMLNDVPDSVYIIQLVKYDSHHNPTYIDEIWVDKLTGEVKSPSGDKG